MSVCYFLPATAEAGAETPGNGEEETVVMEQISMENTQQQLQQFWVNVMEDIQNISAEHFKTQALPLARIKKIMKLDEEVKMISAEAPVLFAKAAEIFIHELTLRAWAHTEDNKRRTLQRNDIAMAISKSDQFDFLIDIVPRQEIKPNKPRDDTPRATVCTDQVSSEPTTTVLAGSGHQHIVLQPCAQLVQSSSTGTSAAGSSGSVVASQQQPLTLVQQVVTSSGEVQQVPIQLTQAQLNLIRMQVQNNPNQPILIQAQQPQQTTPQIIQVTSQAQQPQQLYLAQVATTQEES